MTTIDLLIDRYPLKLLPLSGDLHALVWYTYEDGHHAVVAPSEKSVLSTYAKLRFSRQHGHGGQPKTWWTLRVVAPPRRYVERAAEVLYAQDIASFQCWLFQMVDEVLVPEITNIDFETLRKKQSTARLASPFFKPCVYVDPPWFATWLADARAAGPEQVELVESEQADYRLLHSQCAGVCYDGVAPTTGTWADFYEQHRGVWEEETKADREVRNRNAQPDERRRFRDDLPIADPGKTLFAACANFGHHSNGLVFEEVTDSYLTDHFQPGRVLFFFQGERRDCLPAAISEMLQVEREREQQAKAAAKIQREAEKQADKLRTHALFDRIFRGER